MELFLQSQSRRIKLIFCQFNNMILLARCDNIAEMGLNLFQAFHSKRRAHSTDKKMIDDKHYHD